MASAALNTSRRALLAGFAALPIAATAALPSQTPFRVAEARYWASIARFEALPASLESTNPAAYETEVDALTEARWTFWETRPGDWNEFAAALEIATDRGDSVPSEDEVFQLLTDARRLSGRIN